MLGLQDSCLAGSLLTSSDLFGGGYNLASGETRNASQGMHFNPETNYVFGTYTMTMIIDPTNIIPEPDENNNTLQITFELIPEHPQKTDTCFPSSGYSAPWKSDPDTPSRDVAIIKYNMYFSRNKIVKIILRTKFNIVQAIPYCTVLSAKRNIMGLQKIPMAIKQ